MIDQADQVVNDECLVREGEGLLLCAYLDDKCIWTTAWGFNLERQGADAALRVVGLDPARIRLVCKNRERQMGGKIKGDRTPELVCTKEQAESLFQTDMAAARKQIRVLVPNYDKHPAVVQAVLIDLLYNMGFRTLSLFTTTLGYVFNGEYVKAANQLALNKYHHDVGKRAIRNEHLLATSPPLKK